MSKRSLQKWINELSITTLPKSFFEISFSRSSGPGGQNVNKLNTKTTIKLPAFKQQQWIPDEIKQLIIKNNINDNSSNVNGLILKNKFRYLTKNGDIIIQNDTMRSTNQNLNLCFEKFINELKNSIRIIEDVDDQTLKKWDKIRNKSNESRLKEKKFTSLKKQSRKFTL